jgi:regulator-associated protein of mTOR
VDQINMMLLDTPSVGDYVASVVRNSLLNHSNADSTLGGAAGSLDNNGAPSSFYVNDSSTTGPHSAAATRPAKLTRSVSFASTLRTIYNFGNVSPMNPTEQPQQSTATPDRTTLTTPHPRPSPLSNSNNSTTPTEPLVPPNNTSDAILPLSSEFYDWSCEYFTEPQMRVSKSNRKEFHDGY